MFNAGAIAARAYGLPVNEVLRDLGKSPEILARFGVANRKEFAVAAAKARSYGLALKEVNGAFGEQLDTFEGSATAAAKLNSMFGTTINSFDLMMQTDPTKRMEMLRRELLAQGKTWEKLTVFERNSITTTLGVDKATAQLMLSTDKERKSLEAKAKERENQIKIDEKWNAGMGSIKKTLIAWGPLLDKLMRAASNFIVRLFGGDDASSKVAKTADIAENAIKSITKAIEDASDNIDYYRDFWYQMSEPFDSSNATDLIDLINKQNKSMDDQRKIKHLMSQEDVRSIANIKLRRRGLNNQEINGMFGMTEYMVNKNLKNAAPSLREEPDAVVQDAFISKAGKITQISEDDHIMVRKDMSNVNTGNDGAEVVKAINGLTEQIAKMMSKGSGEVVINLDGKEIARTIISNSRR